MVITGYDWMVGTTRWTHRPPRDFFGTGLDPSRVGRSGLGVVTAAARHSAGEHGAGARFTMARAR